MISHLHEAMAVCPSSKASLSSYYNICGVMNDDQTIRISSGAPWEEAVGYVRALRRGKMIWVSGTAPMEAGAVAHVGNPYEQAMTCLRIIEQALISAGATMEDVVRTRIYVTNIADWAAIGKAHAAFFGHARPTTSMVQVAKLIDPDILVEIEVDACLA